MADPKVVLLGDCIATGQNLIWLEILGDVNFSGDILENAEDKDREKKLKLWYLKNNKEKIVSSKPELKSQHISSAESILKRLNIQTEFLRLCRVYNNISIDFDPLLECVYTLDEYVDSYTKMNYFFYAV